MDKIKLVTDPNAKVLREPTKLVKSVTQDIKDLIPVMRKIMKENNGIGLAANQVGLPIKLFVAEPAYSKSEKGKFYVFINPEIISRSQAIDEIEEGCLSVPGTYGVSKRSKTVTITGMNEYGKKVKMKAHGLLAWIFQHETDHLNGTLYIDNATQVKRAKKT